MGGWPVATQWLHAFRNEVYFHWGIGNVLVLNVDTKKTVYHRYDQQLFAPATDHTNTRFYVGDAGRFVRRVEDPDATTDAGTTIDCEAESMDFTLQTRRHFPRWAKYDFNGSAATSPKGEIILDGVVHQTHTLAGNRKTNRRLIDTGNARRCSIRVSWTGAGTLYAAEME